MPHSEPGSLPDLQDQDGVAVDRSGRRQQLQQEQERVSSIYRRLDDLREHTGRRLAEVRRADPGGTHQNRSERDAFATLYEDRLAQLNAVEDRLVFGRLDLRDGERQYIGRLGLSDTDHQPMLTDWRAPAARPFYQATAAHPGEVVLRRHLQTRSRHVVGLEDDLLDAEAVGHDVVLNGEGALLAALNAQRTGRMNDIVATIQAEQDAIIRSRLDGVLVVEGGPGTGKTAVALHRAAYLLYAHREAIARSGVLVVGPSPTFLRYIEQVLPALGETGVVSTTIGQLIPGIEAEGTESAEVAEIKGRPVWARIIANAIKARQRILPEQELRVGSLRLQLRTEDMQEARRRARRTHGGHNKARVTFVRHMLAALAEQYVDTIGGGAAEESDIVTDLRQARDVRVALNLCWMPLTATGLLQDLYAKPHRLAEAAPRLSAADRRALRRERGAPWTVADIPLLDEAAELLGDDDEAARAELEAQRARHAEEVAYAQEMLAASGAGGGLVSAETVAQRFSGGASGASTAERAGADRSWTYGHVVVDEAQELSAMAWRALLRRNPRRSMTIVGDVWQTSSSAGATDWAAMLQRPLRGDFRTAALTVNYRTPASIMALAQSAMRSWNPALPPAEVTSAREVPGAVVTTAAEDLQRSLAPIVEQERARTEGTIAVLTSPGMRAQIARALGVAGPVDLRRPVVVLDAAGSKGLEFDVVVLAEPGQILKEAPAADLYVAMTRATQRLHLVHAQELPAELASAD
ncbi:MAG TPA: UvrD-helicase domain-containing protein [Ruania sp.]|nr:UvrD-helicase domain-containing protein [Ruania sp.]